jgi:hypothetical protein
VSNLYTQGELEQINNGQFLERWGCLHVLHQEALNGQMVFIVESRDHPETVSGMSPVASWLYAWFSNQWNESPHRSILKTRLWIIETLEQKKLTPLPTVIL